MGVVFLVLHVIWDCSLNMNACGCYAVETLISGDVFILAGNYLRLKTAGSVSPVGRRVCSLNLSLVLSSLAEAFGFCPVRAWVRAQLEVWTEFTHSAWDFASLALFFLISHYLWLLWTLSVVPPLFFWWALELSALWWKLQSWGIRPIPAPSLCFWLLSQICQPLFTSDSLLHFTSSLLLLPVGGSYWNQTYLIAFLSIIEVFWEQKWYIFKRASVFSQTRVIGCIFFSVAYYLRWTQPR